MLTCRIFPTISLDTRAPIEAQAFDGVPIHLYGTSGGISAPSGHLAPGKKHISIPSLDKKSVIMISLHIITSCVHSVKNPVRPGLNTATFTFFSACSSLATCSWMPPWYGDMTGTWSTTNLCSFLQATCKTPFIYVTCSAKGSKFSKRPQATLARFPGFWGARVSKHLKSAIAAFVSMFLGLQSAHSSRIWNASW